jgi:hypothetical protein
MSKLDTNYVKDVIKEILNKAHTNPNKLHVADLGRRLNFSCPVCGDSKNTSKKRGNVWTNSLMFQCFNCGCLIHFNTLCKKYNIEIDPIKKEEWIKHSEEQVKYESNSNEFIINQLNRKISLSELCEYFNSQEGFVPGRMNLSNFGPIQPGSPVDKYLTKRKVSVRENIYQADWWITNKWVQPVLVNLNKKDDILLGMQLRNLEEGEKRKFRVFPFSELWNFLNEPLDPVEAAAYNKLSYYYNILNIDYGSPITVFEGYIDSTFFPNSVGLVGSFTDINFFLNPDLDTRFFFDNDETGITKSLEILKKGKDIFMWHKMFDELSRKSKDPYAMFNKLTKIKDLNKLAQHVPNPYRKLELEKFFTKDEMDLIHFNMNI